MDSADGLSVETAMSRNSRLPHIAVLGWLTYCLTLLGWFAGQSVWANVLCYGGRP